MKQHFGLIGAWMGTGLAWFGSSELNSPWLAFIGVVCAIVASLFTILSRWNEVRHKRLQTELLKQQMCDECRNGTPPGHCPFNQMPERCSLRWKASFKAERQNREDMNKIIDDKNE